MCNMVFDHGAPLSVAFVCGSDFHLQEQYRLVVQIIELRHLASGPIRGSALCVLRAPARSSAVNYPRPGLAGKGFRTRGAGRTTSGSQLRRSPVPCLRRLARTLRAGAGRRGCPAGPTAHVSRAQSRGGGGCARWSTLRWSATTGWTAAPRSTSATLPPRRRSGRRCARLQNLRGTEN